MTEDEVFSISPTNEELIHIIEDAFKYAVLSVNFTVDRTKSGYTKHGYENRISYIIRGRVPQFILINYLLKQNIPVNYTTCDTPYFSPDKRDFIIGKTEFDIKCFSTLPYHGKYTDLPALCPTEQFKKNIENKGIVDSFAYIYAFVQKNWFSLKITDSQANYLEEMFNRYNGATNGYDDPENFYRTFISLGYDNYSINFLPKFVFCGYNTINHWSLFSKAIQTSYPLKNPVIKLRINNMVAPMDKLPSFKSYIDSIKKEIFMNNIELQNANDIEELKKIDDELYFMEKMANMENLGLVLSDMGKAMCGSYYEGLVEE